MKEWYVIYVRTGKEEEVRSWLLKNCNFYNHEVLVPKIIKYEWKKGKKEIASRILFKGYVLIYMDLSNQDYQEYYNIKENPYVYHLIGSGDASQFIVRQEMNILLKLVDDEGIVQLTTAYYTGDKINYVSGPLCGAENLIYKINKRKERAYIRINIVDKISAITVGLKILKGKSR